MRRRPFLRRQVLAERRERLVHEAAIVAQRRARRESARRLLSSPPCPTAAGITDAAAPKPGVAPVCPLYRNLRRLPVPAPRLRRPAGAQDRRDPAAVRGAADRGGALRPLPHALRLSIEADAALPPPARRSRAGDRLPARGAARVTHRRPRLPDRDAGRERAPRRAARGRARALVGLPARGDAARARGVVGRHRRPARRGHRTGRRSRACGSWRATSSRTTHSCSRAWSPTSRAKRRPAARASWSTPTAAAACWGWRRRRTSSACSASRSAPAP